MYKNILLPIVPGHTEDIQNAMDVAKQLGDDGAKFTVMHVMETIPGYVMGQIPDNVVAQRRIDTQQALEHIAADLPGASAELVSGHAGQTIINYANDHDVDCIILASHATRLEAFFIGSTANRVVHLAKCAVHVIR
ncbi:universal stress protein [Tateyamaria armeniaca]|uniref:Universal stress protein n=1 Tax=Tateyamaria armeniaca TaxID=2518930 RepID=A0ABW8UWM6_9RHOB